MISKKKDSFLELKRVISKETKIAKEIGSLYSDLGKKHNSNEKNSIEEHIKSLKNALREANNEIPNILRDVPVVKSYPAQKQIVQAPALNAGIPISPEQAKPAKKEKTQKDFESEELESDTLKRIKKKEEKITTRKERKPSKYVSMANRMFSERSSQLINKGVFKTLERDLTKANIEFLLKSYVSIIFFTTFLSVFVAVFIFMFFLFFNVGVKLPIITLSADPVTIRFLKTFWILFAVPTGTFLFMYTYPSLERDSIEKKINQELPFATIHMAAISGSMIDPTKIFSIITMTKEYPYLDKEFRKLMNSINVLGYDFVSVLRNSAFNTASKKLVDLYNGLATTISSGGDLPRFFDERAEGLLFEYNLEKEKSTRAAETFMDIYISVVIAAPMILMLLLMMMRISGLGLALSTSMITLVMVLGVSIINVVFLTFLQIRQSNG